MPFIVRHDSQIPALVGLAANVGADRTARENLQDNLAVGGYELHQQQEEDQIRARQADEAIQAMQLVMQDDRQRDINQTNASTRLATTDLNGQYGERRALVQQEGANQRTAYTTGAANDRNTANNDIRLRVANDRNDVTTRGQDLTNGLGYDRLQAQQQRDADRAEERRALESFKTLQQQQRRGVELDVSTRRNVINAELREIMSLRNINERRARDPQSSPEEKAAASARIGPLNDEAQKRIAALGTLSPRPAGAAAPGAPASPPPTPYDAQQPGMAQPAPSMNNLMQQPVNAPGPQSMAAPPSAPVRVSTVEQARTLPRGTQFVDPYGTIRVVA